MMTVEVVVNKIHNAKSLTQNPESTVTQLARLDLTSTPVLAKLDLN